MRIADHPQAAAAILLAALVAVHQLLGGAGGWPRGASLHAPVHQALPAPGSSAGKTLAWCRENVAIIHDVYWASACAAASGEAADNSADCTLPDDRAGALNLARAKAEQQCMEEAAAAARWGVGAAP
jgi:hypothetical protein